MPKRTKQDDKKKKQKKITIFPTGAKDASEHKNRSTAASRRRRVKGKFADEPARPKIERADPDDTEGIKEAREQLKNRRLLEKAERADSQTKRRQRLAAFDAAERQKARDDFVARGRAEGQVVKALEALGYEAHPVRTPDGKVKFGYSDPVEETWVDVEAYTSDFERQKMISDAADRINSTKKALSAVEDEEVPRVSSRVKRAEKALAKIEAGEAIPSQHQVVLNIVDKKIEQANAAFEHARNDPEVTRGELLMLQQDVEILQRDRVETEHELRAQYPRDYENMEKDARLELGAAKGEQARIKAQVPELKERHKKEVDRVLADIKETSVDYPDIVISNPDIMDEAAQRRHRAALAEQTAAKRAEKDAARKEGVYQITGGPVFDSVDDIYNEKRKGKNRYQGEAGGPDPNPRRGGWKGTISFQQEQARRRVRGVREGTDVKSYRVWDKYGVSPKKVPQQKADISIGPNAQYVTATDQFDFIDPNDRTQQTVLEFSLKNPPQHAMNIDFLMHQPVRLQGTNAEGRQTGPITTDSQGIPEVRQASFADLGIEETDAPTLEAAAKAVGLTGYFAEQPEGEGHVFRFVTPQGEAINEDQLLQLESILDERFSLQHVDGEGITKVRGADLQRRVITTPYGASKPGVQEGHALRTEMAPVTGKQAEVKLARRDREGNLKQGEADSLLLQTPGFIQNNKTGKRLLEPRLVTLNMQERSDAIGFGRSWRPGEQELNKLVTAVPREKKRREIEDAVIKANDGDSTDLDRILKEDNPYANKNTLEHLKGELLIAGDAGAAAVLYAGTRTAQRKLASKALEDTRAGRWIDEKTSLTNLQWFRDANNSLGRDAADWYSEKKWMVKRPLSDPERQVGGIEWNPYRYRAHLISKDKARGRQIEREARLLEGRVKTRQNVLDALQQDPTDLSLRGRLDRAITLRSAHLVGGDAYDNQTLADRAATLRESSRQTFATSGGKHEIKHAYGAYHSADSIHLAMTAPGAAPTVPINDALEAAYQNTNILKPGTARKVGKFGLYGAAGLATVGAGVFAYDKYKEHQMEAKGEDYVSIGSRMAKPLPKNVYKPTVQVKKQYTKPLPHTYITDAVDLEGKKVLKGVKVKGRMEKVPLRPTDRKDVGGDTYQQGPLIGTPSINLRPDLQKSNLFFEKDLRARNATTVEAGPVYLQVGRKRRWEDTRATKLRSANPNKMTSAERDLAAMDYLHGTATDKSRAAALHMGDYDFHELVTDPDSVASLERRTANSYAPRISKKAQDAKTAKEKLANEVDRARLDELFHGRTVEDADQLKRMNRLLDQDYEQRNKEW